MRKKIRKKLEKKLEKKIEKKEKKKKKQKLNQKKIQKKNTEMNCTFIYHFILQTQSHLLSDILAHSGGSDDEDHDDAIDLDQPHPPLSPMFARKLANDDMPLKDFSDTLFISTGRKNFNVPHPKKISEYT